MHLFLLLILSFYTFKVDIKFIILYVSIDIGFIRFIILYISIDIGFIRWCGKKNKELFFLDKIIGLYDGYGADNYQNMFRIYGFIFLASWEFTHIKWFFNCLFILYIF